MCKGREKIIYNTYLCLEKYFLTMKKTINCFIPYGESAATEQTIKTLKNSGLIQRIYLLAPSLQHILSIPEGCEIICIDSLTSSETMQEIALRADTHYTLLYTKESPLELTEKALEKMIAPLEDNRCGMVYSNHYEWKNGNKQEHPLIDYQEGSFRDDFDFGSVLLFNSYWFVAISHTMERIKRWKYAGLYYIRLYLSHYASINRIPEYLYTEIEEDNQKSGEKQFDYVKPGNRNVQLEMEQCFTLYLKSINAWLPPFPTETDPKEEDTPFTIEASIIIPVRNRVRTIEDAIRSALSQKTNFPFNIIIVDNHSTDGTSELINKYADYKEIIHLIPSSTDLGIGGCWSLAVHHPSCGRFAVQLDSDDLYSDEHTLQTIVDKFYQEKCAMVIGTYRMTDFKLNTIEPGIIDHREWTDNNGRNNALRINGLGAPRAFLTPILRNISIPNVSYGEDYALGLAFSRQYKIGRIYDVLYLCRRWEGNSDAALSVEHVNANNLYKDSLRTKEIRARMEYMANKENYEKERSITQFIKNEIRDWNLAYTNHQALKNIKIKEVNVHGMSFTVQFNPMRSISSHAKVDTESIKQRPCFLCAENRPKEQKRMEWREYELCVNPYPILPQHATIIHKQHIPQRIPRNLFDFIEKELAHTMPSYALFYNGAACGASAPDHLHLQCVRSQDIPVIRHIDVLLSRSKQIDMQCDFDLHTETTTPIRQLKKLKASRLYVNKEYPAPIFILQHSGSVELLLLASLLKALPRRDQHTEPMFNLLMWPVNDWEYFTIVFPRSKHRPACYFASDDTRMLISPGTLDMAGLIVATREEDFARMTDKDIDRILKEVGLSADETDKVIKRYFIIKSQQHLTTNNMFYV